MSVRILVKFVGGPADGETRWHEGGDYIEIAPIPPVDFTKPLEEIPNDSVTCRKYLYRIDTQPQPGGAYLARLLS